MLSPLISYNLKERGRRYRGKPRNFDVRAIVDCINGGAVQERVKHGDMLGYYGHWPRVRFGLNPSEGGIVDGEVIHVEPAFKTTLLRASADGTIEHQAEFLDNAPGRAAYGLMASKTGGFSSAIDESKPDFYGFDYVLEPNFSTNRAYRIALDDAGEEIPPLTLDEVNDYMAAAKQMADALELVFLLDSVNAQNTRMREVLLNMEAEREVLEDELRRARTQAKAGGGKIVTLDQIGDLHISSGNPTARLFDQAERYRTMPAASRVSAEKPAEARAAESSLAAFQSMIGFVA